jgi:hypothetical protein
MCVSYKNIPGNAGYNSWFHIKVSVKKSLSAYFSITDSRDQKSVDDRFNFLFVQLSDSEINAFAHQPSKMIKKCTFTGRGFPQDDNCKKLMNSTGVKIFTPSSGAFL